MTGRRRGRTVDSSGSQKRRHRVGAQKSAPHEQSFDRHEETPDDTNARSNQADLAAVKERQRQAWASGDFAVVAARIVLVAEQLCDTADLRAGWRVLDVATGSGNAAIAAARHGCTAVGVDYVPALLEAGRRRAAAEGLAVELLEGDAESLPFPDACFDAVTSVFGCMFAPDHARAAAELLRVCRPGGTIALAAWTPDGFIGELFRTVAAHVPPPAGVPSPMLWGTEAHLRELLGEGIAWLEVAERTFTFRFESAEDFVDVLPHLVRADPQGLRGARRQRPRRPRARPRRARRPVRPARCRRDRDPGDLHRGRGDHPLSPAAASPRRPESPFDREGEPMTAHAPAHDAIHARLELPVRPRVGAGTYGLDVGRSTWLTTEEWRAALDRLQLGPGSRTLDVACGSGGPALELARTTGAAVVGVDRTARRSRGRTSGHGATVSECSPASSTPIQARPLPFADDSFDAVTCIDAICHVPNRFAVLREWHRVLKRGGHVLFTDPLVVTGAFSSEEIALRASIGFFGFSLLDEDIRLVRQPDSTTSGSRTRPAASSRWRSAGSRCGHATAPSWSRTRARRPSPGTQRFLSTVHTLAREQRLSRFTSHARATAARTEPQIGTRARGDG